MLVTSYLNLHVFNTDIVLLLLLNKNIYSSNLLEHNDSSWINYTDSLISPYNWVFYTYKDKYMYFQILGIFH